MRKCMRGECEHGLDMCCLDCPEKCSDMCMQTEPCPNIIPDESQLVTLDKAEPALIDDVSHVVSMIKKLQDQEKTMREKLQAAMEKYNIKAFDNDRIRVTYIAPTTRTSVDTARLKKEHPEIAEAYQKVSDVKASVKIEVK